MEGSIVRNLWELPGLCSIDSTERTHLLERLKPLRRLQIVSAAGIEVAIPQMPTEYLENHLLPLCLFLEKKRLGLRTQRILVGICGAPGAGKTVFSAILSKALNLLFSSQSTSQKQEENELEEDPSSSCCCVLGMDAYHLPNQYLDSHFVLDAEGKTVPLRLFKGAPHTFDAQSFINDLEKLRNRKNNIPQLSSSKNTNGSSNGKNEQTNTEKERNENENVNENENENENDNSEEIRLPVYDRKLHDPVPGALIVKAQHKFVLVEGMLLLCEEAGFERVKPHLDLCIYLDVSHEETRRRVVERKVLGGRDKEDAERHYERVDKPNACRVAGSKSRADLVLTFDNSGFIVSAELLNNLNISNKQ
jgi:pantothenate kinase